MFGEDKTFKSGDEVLPDDTIPDFKYDATIFVKSTYRDIDSTA